MTKADVINKIMEATGLQKREVSVVVESFMETVKDSLLKDKENVYLRGGGSCISKRRAERAARNSTKNTTGAMAAHDLPCFKPAKSFVEQMKGE